ncbi:AAA family ATPase [uncultured Salipiger sp.]|uniref:AAA family ATPase n=1 Tax=uncultured Salipiger sp. TaxID=499810 RepID=UPI00338FF200
MPEINIKSFSCIRNASIALKKLNVIIGPQGSGKSVTTKLVYFFADIPLDSVRHAEDGSSFSDYKKIIQKRFALWFPPIAWG